jgi:phage tail sheath gpL-like
MKLTEEQLKERIAHIREQDIVLVLENAVNYGDPWRALYLAAIEEIKELRNDPARPIQ